MKFTQEQALEQIKGELGQTQYMTDRTITDTLTALMPVVANDEMELTDFVEKVKPVFITNNGNIKNETTAYIKYFNEKNPKPGTPPATPPITPPATPPAAGGTKSEELLEKLLGLVESQGNQIKEMKMQEVTKSIKEGAKASFFNLKPAQTDIANYAIDEIFSTVTDKDTAEGLSGRIKEKYEKLVQLSGKNGYVPADGTGGNGDGSALKDRLNRLAESKNKAVGGTELKKALGLIK